LPLHERALLLLAVRSRSKRELERRLLSAGFEEVAVREELARLEAVGLVDDARFAQEFAEQQVGRRLSGTRAVAASLAAMGVDRHTAELVLEAQAGDDGARAAELARARASRLSGLPPQVARRRLVSFLLRHGYDFTVARRAAGMALGLEPDGDG
jgi:regulatory protein